MMFKQKRILIFGVAVLAIIIGRVFLSDTDTTPDKAVKSSEEGHLSDDRPSNKEDGFPQELKDRWLALANELTDSATEVESETGKEPHIVDCSLAFDELSEAYSSGWLGDTDGLSQEEIGARVHAQAEQLEGAIKLATDELLEFVREDRSASANIKKAILEPMYDPAKSIAETRELILAAIAQEPNNALAHSLLLGQCLQEPEICSDSEQEFIEDAGRVGWENGYIWSQIASLHLKNGDADATFKAVHQAAYAPVYDNYSIRKAATVIEAFPLSTVRDLLYAVMGDNVDISLLTEISDEQLTRMFVMSEISESSGREDIYWTQAASICGTSDDGIADVCTDLEKRATQNESLSDYVLEEDGYQIRDGIPLDEDSRSEQDQIKFEQQFLGISAKVKTLMVYEPALIDMQWESWLQQGQRQGMLEVVNEAIRLSSDPDYNPCPTNEDSLDESI